MKRLVLSTLFALSFIASAFAQQGGGVVMKGPVTPGQCATWFATNILQGATCGGGTAGSIAIGTTTVSGGLDTAVWFTDGTQIGQNAGYTFDKTTQTLTIANAAGTGNAFKITGSNTTFPSNPYIRNDGANLVIAPATGGTLFISTSQATSIGAGGGSIMLGGDTSIATGKNLQLGSAVVNGVPVSNGTVTLKDNTGTTVQVLVVHP